MISIIGNIVTDSLDNTNEIIVSKYIIELCRKIGVNFNTKTDLDWSLAYEVDDRKAQVHTDNAYHIFKITTNSIKACIKEPKETFVYVGVNSILDNKIRLSRYSNNVISFKDYIVNSDGTVIENTDWS